MKKLLILGLGLTMLNLTSCKKGENDPGISLKGRKGRLAGEWTLVTLETSSTYTDYDSEWDDATSKYIYSVGTSTSTTSIANGVETRTYSNEETPNKYSNTTEITYIFDKDGTYTFTYKSTPKTDWEGEEIPAADAYYESSTESGTWSFVSKNKDGDYKNKERVSIVATSGSSTEWDWDTEAYVTEADDVYSGDQGSDQFLYLDRLSNKELTLMSSGSSTGTSSYYDNNTDEEVEYTDIDSWSSTSTWEKK